MTPAEFKAWFDGFTEGMDGPPSAKQWEKITKKVKQIDNTSVLTPVYVDRWWPVVQPYWQHTTGGLRPCPVWYGAGSASSLSAGTVSSSTVRMSADELKAQNFTPTASALLMAEGRADALAAA